MQDSSYGFDVNLTMVTNDLKSFDAGIKMTCSDGFKFDRTIKGMSFDDACDKIAADLDKEYAQYLDSLSSYVEGNTVEDRLKRLERENERLRQELVAAKAKKGSSQPDRAESVGPMPEHKKPSRVKMGDEFNKDIFDLLKMFV